MAPTHACTLRFGKFKGQAVEALMFNPDGYEFLWHFAKERDGQDAFASLRAFTRRLLDMGEQVLSVQQCTCGKPAVYAKYFSGSAMFFESFHCEECKPSRRDLGQSHQLIPLKFSSQRHFRDQFERKRFVDLLIRALGVSRPITAGKAFRFFFPVEAEAQAEALRKQVPTQLAFALGLL